MLIDFGGQLMLHITIQKNITCQWLLGWVGHSTSNSSLYSCNFNGFDPVIFFICHQIEVLYQFWIHTEYIGNYRLQSYIVTPSHHRVHHSRNKKYLIRTLINIYCLGQIIWNFSSRGRKPFMALRHQLILITPLL
jgi:sterol desaturase/sphingolipid hydroxylase (fatty acid hydroxylase superfamily)